MLFGDILCKIIDNVRFLGGWSAGARSSSAINRAAAPCSAANALLPLSFSRSRRIFAA